MDYRYFTTPIYYANGQPHAGHLYATFLAGILKRHFVQRGMNVRFLTGLDEHGEAVEQKAKECGLTPQELVDKMALLWQDEFARFGVDYDIFLRTTSADHIKNVQEILTACYEKGDISFGHHEGHYCLKCEGFLAGSERDEQDFCLIHKIKTVLRQEENYFFKTTKYRDVLKQKILEGALTTQERYKNELLAMLDQLDGDLSISRPKSRLTWGIELPFDHRHVAYVWFDALPNYTTGIGGVKAIGESLALGGLAHSAAGHYWQTACHILGKDILKFHGIFWPAMCLSLGLPLPRLLVTGWLLQDGHKMSKSLGNVVSVDQILRYGRDMFVNYAFRMTNPGEDIDIVWKTYFERYNADLANGVGNLFARTLGMIEKYCEGVIPGFFSSHEGSLLPFFSVPGGAFDLDDLIARTQTEVQNVKNAFDNGLVADALVAGFRLVAMMDRCIADLKPWEKDNVERRGPTLALSVAALRVIGSVLLPFFPEKMAILLASLGEPEATRLRFFQTCDTFATFRQQFLAIQAGFTIPRPFPRLYPRFEPALEVS